MGHTVESLGAKHVPSGTLEAALAATLATPALIGSLAAVGETR